MNETVVNESASFNLTLDSSHFFIFILLAFIPVFIVKRKRLHFSTFDFILWYVYSLCLWLIAFIHALAFVKNEKECIHCPACKELIKKDAAVCKYCHTILTDWYREHPVDESCQSNNLDTPAK